MDDLRKRIEGLTSSQRAELAKLLGCEESVTQRLVAYVVPPQEGEAPDLDELQRFLNDKLPGYMVPSSVVVLDALPRLPNGKLDSQAMMAIDPSQQHGVSNAPVTSSDGSKSDLEQVLTKIWMEVLGTDDVRVGDNFFEIGGDSIMSIRIVALSREAGIAITPNDLMENQTIAELATVALWNKREKDGPKKQSEANAVGKVPLTPIQSWFFEMELATPEHWNQAMLVDVPADTDAKNLEAAIIAVFKHHDILRAQFHKIGEAWEQRIAPADAKLELTLPVVQCAPDAVDAHLAELHKDMRFGDESSPLARFALICNESGEPHTFAMILHHLIVDNISWRIVLEDLTTAYQQIADSAETSLPEKTTSYKKWAEHIAGRGISDALRAELNYWTEPPGCAVAKMPRDVQSDGSLIESDSRVVRLKFPKDQTESLLREANTAYNTRAHDLLIVALVQTLLKWSGGAGLRLGLEGFGRDDFDEAIDVTRSVGWFTTFYTVTLQLDPSSPEETAMKTIKEQLRAVPNRGIGYGLLRYLSQDKDIAEKIRTLPREEVLFNYLGSLPKIEADDNSGLVRSVRSVSENARASDNPRSHLLEINAYVDNGELELLWTYNTRAHTKETIEKLGQRYFENLSKLIAHCLDTGAGGYTPSDFPDADLDQEDLDRFLKSIG